MRLETKMPLVMLIDDNEIDTFISKRVIERANFAKEIQVFNSAIEALGYLKNPGNYERLPELIFLDINMPIMDGFGFLKEFDKLASHIQQKCKIMLLSSSCHSTDVHNISQQRNVADFIIKPLNYSVLEGLDLDSRNINRDCA